MPTEKPLSDIEKQILKTIENIKYGSVEVLIHDSRIVQIEKSEKIRFDTSRYKQQPTD
jgi:hypothetical protein